MAVSSSKAGEAGEGRERNGVCGSEARRLPHSRVRVRVRVRTEEGFRVCRFKASTRTHA
jgi:hypothetical protein